MEKPRFPCYRSSETAGLPVADLKYNVFQVYNPRTGRWHYYRLPFCTFGSLTSIFAAVSYGHALMFILRVAGICSSIYIDDTLIAALLRLMTAEMGCVDFIFALLRQPVKREKSDQHAAILQITITALGMNYSMPRLLQGACEDIFPEADMFVIPTFIKIQRLIALGELLSRVE
jgi:hypothetical protein